MPRKSIKRKYLLPKIIILIFFIILNLATTIILYNQIHFTNTLKYFVDENIYYYDQIIEEANYIVAPIHTEIYVENEEYVIRQIPYSKEVRELINFQNFDVEIKGNIPKDNTNQILVPQNMIDIEIQGYEIVGTYETSNPSTDIIYYAYQDVDTYETASICIENCPANYTLTNENTLYSFRTENRTNIFILMILILLNVFVFVLLYKIIPVFMKKELSFNEYYDIKLFKYNKVIIIYSASLIMLVTYICATINF